MTKWVADLWVSSLPKYKQGKKSLNKEGAFCCLGVLCDLAVGYNITAVHPGQPNGYGYGPSGTTSPRTNYLPEEVRVWAGMQTHDGRLDMGSSITTLVDMNDNGLPFDRIGRVIKENWEQL